MLKDMRMRDILAYVGAGIAAALTRLALVFMRTMARYADPPGVRLLPLLVFFVVLVLINRRALKGIITRGQPWS